MEDIFNDLYYNLNNPSSFSSVKKLYVASKNNDPNIKLSDVKDWLSKQLTYTLHKDARRRYSRNKILVSDISEQFQADLVDMAHFSSSNRGYKYILTVIDCFSAICMGHPPKN